MSFFEQIWIPFTQGYFVPSLVETDWAVLEQKIFKLDNVFLLIPVYLPLEKGVTLNLYKIESPSPKDALGQVLLKFAPWFLRKLLNCQCMFAISCLSPLQKGCDPSFEQIWISFIQKCFVPSLVEIGTAVLEKKIFKFCLCIFAIL